MKRVLVTGANGFVCSNIVDVLLQRDFFVYAVDLHWDNPACEQWPQERVQRITCRVEDTPDFAVSALVHGAALTADADELGLSAEDYFDAHLQPTFAMLRYAQHNVSGRSMFISSSAVFRQTSGLVTEDTPTHPLGLYPVAKQTTESLIETLKVEHGRDVCCIRLGNVYGAHEYSRPSRPRISGIQQMIAQAQTSGSITVDATTPIREWTLAADIGAAVVALLEADAVNHALYNVAAARQHTWLEIAEAIAAAIPTVQIQTSSSAHSGESLPRSGILDHARLRDDVGFSQWTSLQDGIAQTIASHKKEARHA